MAANWHTMAVISCPVLFCSLHWIPVGYKHFGTGRKNSDPPNHLPTQWGCELPAQSLVSSPSLSSVKRCRGSTKRQRERKPCKVWDGGKQQLFLLLMQLKNIEFGILRQLNCFGTVKGWPKWNEGVPTATHSHLRCPSISPFFCRLPPSQLRVWLAWRTEGKQTRGGVTASAAQA